MIKFSKYIKRAWNEYRLVTQFHSISDISTSDNLFYSKESRLCSAWNRRFPIISDIDSYSRHSRADKINYALAVSASSFERKSRPGEEMRLPFLADASRHVYGCGVECIPSSIVSQQRTVSPPPPYIEKQGPGERREIRTSGLIKRYRNDNAVSRRSFGGTMGCIMAGMTRPFLSMATHRRRIVP